VTDVRTTVSDSGVRRRTLADTPITVFALETTGFPAGRHRVCELTLCRLMPDGRSRVLFDSLIDPGRPMGGTAIHGLNEADVRGAPRFEDVAAEVVDALAGSVLAAYNVTFAIDFLRDELQRVGVDLVPPHFCLMFLRSILGLGARCSLEEACRTHDVAFEAAVCSRADAQAATRLLGVLLARGDGVAPLAFADLAARVDLPFTASLGGRPLPTAVELGVSGRSASRRRVVRSLGEGAGEHALRRYWNAVTVALADFELSEVEAGLVLKLQQLLGVSEEEVRAVHARALVAALVSFAGDDWISDDEAEKIRGLLAGLERLGWSPGS
jgi:DNA polymerase-3 subunit epsilon